MANNTSSERLYHILKEQDVSVMGFANRIGLPVTGYKQLYSILHEGEQITKDLAERTNIRRAILLFRRIIHRSEKLVQRNIIESAK